MVCDKRCGRRWYGYVKGKADFCRGHKRDDMVWVHGLCQEEGCMTRASFGAGKKKTHCGAHASDDMRRVDQTRSCPAPGCKKAPTHSLPGEAASHCKDHAAPGMSKRYTSRDCQADGCEKEATFGAPGEAGKFCAAHKTSGMVPTKGLRCGVCEKRASFGNTGQRASRCKEHKLDGMVNVNYATCMVDGCSRGKSHGVEGGEPTVCSIHASEGMLNLREKLCAAQGCSVEPVFGYPEGERTMCAKHKAEGMINVKKNTCTANGCTLASSFAFPGSTGKWCLEHSAEGMENVSRKKCDHPGCQHQATYGPPGLASSRCGRHMLEGFVNQNLHDCTSCGLPYKIPKDSLCGYCDPHGRMRMATREAVVEEYLQKTFPDIPFRHNQRVPGRFCKDEIQRPDFLFDMGTHLVDLEVDENQHKRHPEECELARMYRIVAASGLPVRFLRFNPDPFRVRGQLKTIDQEERFTILTTEIRKALEQPPPGRMIDVRHIFYDAPDERKEDYFVQDTSEEISSTIDNLVRHHIIETIEFS